METTAEAVLFHCLVVAECSESSPTQLSAMEPEILNFGCMHYRRRCKIRVPCCDEVFDCRHCHNEAKGLFGYSCPVCSKSVCDMSSVWNKLEELIASTPMPETYKNKMVWILCNDCGVNSHVQFQIMALIATHTTQDRYREYLLHQAHLG
ncbi:hypothetical protein JHK82_033132 [Glycine max]|nr:hypothetical protein JHK85_033848 [Glycine max]KAG4985532.1 hypothetical protein JHK86_033223 [Glycine max]KAG5118712.1 hypothetical protein JHK82_033132 [Glycine max]